MNTPYTTTSTKNNNIDKCHFYNYIVSPWQETKQQQMIALATIFRKPEQYRHHIDIKSAVLCYMTANQTCNMLYES